MIDNTVVNDPIAQPMVTPTLKKKASPNKKMLWIVLSITGFSVIMAVVSTLILNSKTKSTQTNATATDNVITVTPTQIEAVRLSDNAPFRIEAGFVIQENNLYKMQQDLPEKFSNLSQEANYWCHNSSKYLYCTIDKTNIEVYEYTINGFVYLKTYKIDNVKGMHKVSNLDKGSAIVVYTAKMSNLDNKPHISEATDNTPILEDDELTNYYYCDIAKTGCDLIIENKLLDVWNPADIIGETMNIVAVNAKTSTIYAWDPAGGGMFHTLNAINWKTKETISYTVPENEYGFFSALKNDYSGFYWESNTAIKEYFFATKTSKVITLVNEKNGISNLFESQDGKTISIINNENGIGTSVSIIKAGISTIYNVPSGYQLISNYIEGIGFSLLKTDSTGAYFYWSPEDDPKKVTAIKNI